MPPYSAKNIPERQSSRRFSLPHPTFQRYAEDVTTTQRIRHRWLILVPNTLSALRLVTALALPTLPADWRLYAVFLAAMTDMLDGLAARRFGATSWQGGLLDAVADKLFMLAAVVTLIRHDYLPAAAAIALLTRDIAIALMALYGSIRQRWADFKRVPARWPGKVTTALLFLTFALQFSHRVPDRWLDAVAIGTIFASTVAAIDYATVFFRAIQSPPASK